MSVDGPGTAKSGMHWPSVELLFLCMEYPPLALGQGRFAQSYRQKGDKCNGAATGQ